MGAGSKDHVEIIGRNLREMGKRKKYTFNNANGKSHYMVIRTGREAESEVNRKSKRILIFRKLDNRIRKSNKADRGISKEK